MSKAHIAGAAPLPVQVTGGTDYWWCTCGQSKKQPFCDGSHKGSEFSPLKWTAEADKTAYFCTCKRTSKSPLCDGTHNTL
ncbi:Iron sulphur-containing domain, CDGSH-type [Rhabdaerophilaceae bacterium]